jgi:hypothetical protein
VTPASALVLLRASLLTLVSIEYIRRVPGDLNALEVGVGSEDIVRRSLQRK